VRDKSCADLAPQYPVGQRAGLLTTRDHNSRCWKGWWMGSSLMSRHVSDSGVGVSDGARRSDRPHVPCDQHPLTG